MPELKVSIKNKHASAENQSIVCDNSDYTICFEFDEEWAAESIKTARFIYNNQYIDVVFEGDTCAVPSITSTNYLSVGVFAGDLKTTTPAVFSCCKSILSEDGKPSEPTPDVYAEIMRLLNEKPNAENVYTKAEIDSMLNEKVSSDKVYSKSEVDAKLSEIGNVDLSEIEEKIQQNSDDIMQLKATSEQTDKTVSQLENRNIFTDEEKEKLSELENYDDTEVKEQIEQKANSDKVYSKTEADELLKEKVNSDEVYSKSDIDTMFGNVESILASVVEVT